MEMRKDDFDEIAGNCMTREREKDWGGETVKIVLQMGGEELKGWVSSERY